MDRIAFGDIEMSRITYGVMGLGGSWQVDDRVGLARVREVLDACLEVGMTTLDHADIYTAYRGEAVLGQAFADDPSLRDRFEIVTKCGIIENFGPAAGLHSDVPTKHYDTSAEHVTASLDRSLKLMNIDHVDLLLIHRPDPLIDPDATGRALDRAVSSGKARHVGVSNFRPWDVSLLQSRMASPLVVNQIELSLMATDAFANGDLAFAHEHGLRPMAWSPLGGSEGVKAMMDPGNRLGKAVDDMATEKGCRPDQLALAWLLAHPAGIVPVIGTGNLDRLRAQAEAVDVEISRVEWFALYEAARGVAVP